MDHTQPTNCTAIHYYNPERPRRAQDGLQICAGCYDRADGQLTELPDLVAAILEPSRRAASGRVSGTPEPPTLVNDRQVEGRSLVRYALIEWAQLVVYGRQVTAPQSDVPALCAFLRRHQLWLCAQDNAGAFVAASGDMFRYARRLAYPSPPERTYIGDCPYHVLDEAGLMVVCAEPVYAYPDPDPDTPLPLVTCVKCGTAGTVQEWQRQIVGRGDGIVTSAALLALLSARYMTPVPSSTLYSWVRRGHVRPVDRGRYDFEQVVAYTDTVWTPVGKRTRRRSRPVVDMTPAASALSATTA